MKEAFGGYMQIEFSTEEAHRYGIEEAIMIGYLRSKVLEKTDECRFKNYPIPTKIWLELPATAIQMDVKIWYESKIFSVLESLKDQRVITRKRPFDRSRGYSYSFVKQNKFV